MSTVTKTQLLAGIDWMDAKENNSKSIGTFQEIFGQFEAMLIRKSKTGAKLATILVKNEEGKTKAVCLSENLTALVRSNESVTLEHIMNLPVFKHATHSGIYVGLKGQNFKPVDEIEAIDAMPSAVFNPEDAA